MLACILGPRRLEFAETYNLDHVVFVVILCIFLLSRNHMKTDPTNEYCVCSWRPIQDILFICSTELHCCPETIKNTLMSNTIALDDMLLHEHGHCSLFWADPAYRPPWNK